MNNLISILFYSVCVLFALSLSQVTAQSQFPGMSIIPHVNFTSAPFTTGSFNASSNCDYSSYPDFCIPPPPPNLNCDDVDGKDFKVFRPDPHGFDRDKDGEGCETSE